MHTQSQTGASLAIQVRLQNSLLSAIENFRRDEPDIPTRPEAVRRLLQQALEQRKTKQRRSAAV
jgi:metal-responsive CopG/Arc/MetJ family transcriptional regulator